MHVKYHLWMPDHNGISRQHHNRDVRRQCGAHAISWTNPNVIIMWEIPASHGRGTTFDTGTEELLSRKWAMCQRPTFFFAKIHVNQIVDPWQQIDWFHFDQIRFFFFFSFGNLILSAYVGWPSVPSAWENDYHLSLLPEQETREEASGGLGVWFSTVIQNVCRLCIF